MTENKDDIKGSEAKTPPPSTGEATAAPFIVSSSPHLLKDESIPKIMHTVIAALLPAMAVSVYFFRWDALILIVTCLVASLATEYVCQRVMGKPITIYDGSAAITGILLALTLPPSFPVHGAILGSVFAIAIGKQIFGGLGYNIFNPALLGRAFLQATYPVLITTWTEPAIVQAAAGAVDVITAATPLAMQKFEGQVFQHTWNLILGNVPGSLGETSAIAVIIGGLYLRYKGYINWKLPLGYLGSIVFFGGIFWLIDPLKYPTPLFHIMAGGAMLAAWFMVTDMVTSPTTVKGQWIFVIGAGLIAVLIRLFGGLPEGVMYSILLMNSIVPLINRWTRPKVFGDISEGGGS